MTEPTVVAALQARGCRPRRSGSSSSQWSARCPAHDDRHPSLSVSVTPDGKTLAHCFAGCTVEQVVAALSLTMRELAGRNGERRPVEVARYAYCDADGREVFAVHRREGKRFVQSQPDGRGGRIWNTRGVRKSLYRHRATAVRR